MDDVIGNYGGRLLVAIAGVGIALACLVVVLRFIRNRGPLPFLRGNPGRQARLQVLDSTAVDTRRRLVLVRRDNVEHLIMIGGPTDLVIESRIVAEGDADYDDTQDGFFPAPFDDEPEDEDDEPFEDRRDDARPASGFSPLPRAAQVDAAPGPADAWRSRAESRYAQEEQARATIAPAAKTAVAPATRRLPAVSKPAASVAPIAPAAATRATQSVAAITEQMNDFEKMLEAEMASRLEAGRPQQTRPAGQQAAARSPATPSAPQEAPAAPEQRAMQEQMARIFGGDNG